MNRSAVAARLFWCSVAYGFLGWETSAHAQQMTYTFKGNASVAVTPTGQTSYLLEEVPFTIWFTAPTNEIYLASFDHYATSAGQGYISINGDLNGTINYPVSLSYSNGVNYGYHPSLYMIGNGEYYMGGRCCANWSLEKETAQDFFLSFPPGRIPTSFGTVAIYTYRSITFESVLAVPENSKILMLLIGLPVIAAIKRRTHWVNRQGGQNWA